MKKNLQKCFLQEPQWSFNLQKNIYKSFIVRRPYCPYRVWNKYGDHHHLWRKALLYFRKSFVLWENIFSWLKTGTALVSRFAISESGLRDFMRSCYRFEHPNSEVQTMVARHSLINLYRFWKHVCYSLHPYSEPLCRPRLKVIVKICHAQKIIG